MIRRELLVKNGITFPEEYALSEDRIFNWRLLACVQKVAVSSFGGYFYMQNETSLTHNKSSFERVRNIIQAEIQVYREAQATLQKQNKTDELSQKYYTRRRNAFLSMDALIQGSQATGKQKKVLYKELMPLISGNVIENAGSAGFKWKLLSRAVNKNRMPAIRLWLFAMRTVQKIKRK